MYDKRGDSTAMAYHLWRQAMSGDPDGALRALEQSDQESLPVLSADLLARLYVRVGRVAEAKALWERVLQIDSEYSPAIRALNKLDSPWLLRAVAKSYSVGFGVALLLLLALYGVGMLFFGFAETAYAALGMAAIVAILGVYLAGLFGWVLVTSESLFGLRQSRPMAPISPSRYAEIDMALKSRTARRRTN